MNRFTLHPLHIHSLRPHNSCPQQTFKYAISDTDKVLDSFFTHCLAAKDAYDFLGSPEGELALAQACLYLATAPKSNAAYKALGAARRSAEATGSLMPPKTILNAPTRLMKEIGYGRGYAYDHDAPDAFSGDDYWPEEMAPQRFYEPSPRGFEAKIAERLAYWQRLREERQG